MSTTNRRSRKRKKPDTINDDISVHDQQPLIKRRRLSYAPSKSYMSYKIRNNKAQSQEANDPFKDTIIVESPPSPLSSSSISSSSISSSSFSNNISNVRSQPSTPIRKINIDKRDEPHSQSAKKSRTQIRRFNHDYHCFSSINRKLLSPSSSPPSTPSSPPTLSSPPILSSPPLIKHNNDRRPIPNFGSSQDSISYSPPPPHKSPSHKYHKSPIQTTLRLNNKNNYNDVNNESFSFYEMILFIFIGFFIGYIVSLSVYNDNNNINNMIKCNSCCEPCIIHNNINSNNVRIESIESIENEIECNKCLQQEIRLKRENERLLNGVIIKNGDCSSHLIKINSLEHELGECNVEWGVCQQLGRQKDKLDKIRIEEIDKLRNKFSLCNKKLKKMTSKC